jgi:phosphoenolpyruvate---glycerone phosphotransferase subunit DhaL
VFVWIFATDFLELSMNTTLIINSIFAVQKAILAHEADIESLDRAIGDGDHFINVRRGCEVIVAMTDELKLEIPAQVFHKIGMKLLSTIGGASGPLISSFFMAMGKALDGVTEPSRAQFAIAFAAGVDAIKSRGKADLGEKTMLDVLIPAARLLQNFAHENIELAKLCKLLKEDAHANMLFTKGMIATKGRAHFLGERAIGHIDPGSKTCQVAISAVCDLLTA